MLLLTTEESHARFIMWILLWICGNVKRSRLEEHPFGRKTRVHFYRGAFSLPKINFKAHSFCHHKGTSISFLGGGADMFRQLLVVIYLFGKRHFCLMRSTVNASQLGAAVKERQTETWYCAKLWKCSPVLQDFKRTRYQHMQVLTGGLPLLFVTFVILCFDQVKPLLLLGIMGNISLP